MNTVKRMFLSALILSASVDAFAGEGEVLWWLIGDGYGDISATTQDGSRVTAGQLGVTDARVRYETYDGSASGYLTLFAVNDDGSVSILDGSAGMGAEHGVGLPGGYFGDLSGLSGASYKFIIELGNWQNGQWTKTSMQSDAVSYETLASAGHISVWDKVNHTYGTPWSPDVYYAVPEPSSGILLLLGGALLALRRKRGRA